MLVSPNPGALKPMAYVTFGMYVHGGIVGITTVTKQYPWISRVLTALIQKSDPKHRFTSVGISCNASTEPHRDVYNSEQYQNLIVPLVYPKTGGHLWVAKAPHAQQSGLSRQCGKHEVSGALVALKPALYLDPHCWHATSEWTGDRMLAVGYCLKASNKLGAEERDSLKALGFRIPLASQVTFSSALANYKCSELRSDRASSRAGLSCVSVELPTSNGSSTCGRGMCHCFSASRSCIMGGISRLNAFIQPAPNGSP